MIRTTVLAALVLVLAPATALADSRMEYNAIDRELTWLDGDQSEANTQSATTLTVHFDAKAGPDPNDDILVFSSDSPIDVAPSAAGACPTGDGTNTVECLYRVGGMHHGLVFVSGRDLDDSLTLDEDTITDANLDNTVFEVLAGSGDDEVFGSALGDRLYGGTGADSILGGAGADEITGDTGDDRIAPGSDGALDEVDGGEGGEGAAGDTIVLGDAPAGIDVDLRTPGADGPDGEAIGSTFESVEGTPFDDVVVLGNDVGRALGGAGDDTLVGGTADNVLVGQEDDDTLQGGAGADLLQGDAGDDDLDGGTGADTFAGGDGDDLLRNVLDGAIEADIDGGEGAEVDGDTISYAGSAQGVSVTLDDASEDDGAIGDQENVDATVENVTGTSHDDTIVASNVDENVIRGGAGADALTSDDPNDVLVGGDGVDTYAHRNVGPATVSYAEDTAPITMNGSQVTVPGGVETLSPDHVTIIGTPFADTMTGRSQFDRITSGAGDDTIDLRDGIVDGAADCGEGTDTLRHDTVAAGGVDDPAPVACESINPVVPPADPTPPADDPDPDPGTQAVATRLAGTSARVVRRACPRAQRASGVRDGNRRWCYRLVVRTTLRRVDTGAVVPGQRVNVFRVVGARQVLVQRTTTAANGVATSSRAIVVPRRLRGSLVAANRWLAAQYRSARLRHVASGAYAVARVVTVRTRR